LINRWSAAPVPPKKTQELSAAMSAVPAAADAAEQPPNGAGVPYDCTKCPGYCCSYPVIQLTKADIARLAKHFSITAAAAEKQFTHSAHGYDLVMKRKKDEHYGKICRFFDTQKRQCAVYTARPAVCRTFPNEKRCGYYDFLDFERRHQQDPETVAITNNGLWA
jgi:uncharacterized protein